MSNMSNTYIWCFVVLQTAIYRDKRDQEVYYYHTVQVNCIQTAHGMKQGEATRSLSPEEYIPHILNILAL